MRLGYTQNTPKRSTGGGLYPTLSAEPARTPELDTGHSTPSPAPAPPQPPASTTHAQPVEHNHHRLHQPQAEQTPDGREYCIDHNTKTTSWVHQLVPGRCGGGKLKATFMKGFGLFLVFKLLAFVMVSAVEFVGYVVIPTVVLPFVFIWKCRCAIFFAGIGYLATVMITRAMQRCQAARADVGASASTRHRTGTGTGTVIGSEAAAAALEDAQLREAIRQSKEEHEADEMRAAEERRSTPAWGAERQQAEARSQVMRLRQSQPQAATMIDATLQAANGDFVAAWSALAPHLQPVQPGGAPLGPPPAHSLLASNPLPAGYPNKRDRAGLRQRQPGRPHASHMRKQPARPTVTLTHFPKVGPEAQATFVQATAPATVPPPPPSAPRASHPLQAEMAAYEGALGLPTGTLIDKFMAEFQHVTHEDAGATPPPSNSDATTPV